MLVSALHFDQCTARNQADRVRAYRLCASSVMFSKSTGAKTPTHDI